MPGSSWAQAGAVAPRHVTKTVRIFDDIRVENIAAESFPAFPAQSGTSRNLPGEASCRIRNELRNDPVTGCEI